MQKLILEVSDAEHAVLREPVFLEHDTDLAMGVKQAVEDFMEAHDGGYAMPLVVTARPDLNEAAPGGAERPQPKATPIKIANIRESSEDFHLLATTGRTQTASISLQPGEATGDQPQTHPHSDQTVVVLDGELVAEVGGARVVLRSGQSLIIPAGVEHLFRNEAAGKAFAFTVYAPPVYRIG